VRGKPVVTLANHSTLLLAPTRGHSVKPVEFYDFVESLCPAPRYADLFSRYRHNEKWDVHGDEAPPPQEAQCDSWDEMWARPFDFSKLKDHGDEAAPDDGLDIPASLKRGAP
jgi:hypothetical protein